MAPKGPNDDFEFIMTCLKYSDTKAKPDFNLVAREIGAKSASAAYVLYYFLISQLPILTEFSIAITDTGAL